MRVALLFIGLLWVIVIIDMGCTGSKQSKKTPKIYTVMALKYKCCEMYLQNGLDIERYTDSLRWESKSKGDTVILWNK